MRQSQSVQFQLHPSHAYGLLHLGQPINTTLQYLQSEQHGFSEFPVQLLFNATATTSTTQPPVIHLPSLQLQLTYTADSQQLVSIKHIVSQQHGDVSNTTKSHSITPYQVRYRETLFCSSQGMTPPSQSHSLSSHNSKHNVQPTTFQYVYHLFGATYLGKVQPATSTYMLEYPGVVFEFALTSSQLSALQQQHTLDSVLHLNPPLHSVEVFYGYNTSPEQHQLPPTAATDYYYEPVHVHVNRGVYLCKRKVALALQKTSVQAILADLGAPSSIMYNNSENEALHSIHAPAATINGNGNHYNAATINSALNAATPTINNTTYNYKELGFDLVISGATQLLQKIVLHSNQPTTTHFGIYNKCNWRLVSVDGKAVVDSTELQLDDPFAAELTPADPARAAALHTNNHTPSLSAINSEPATNELQSSATIMDVLNSSNGSSPAVSSKQARKLRKQQARNGSTNERGSDPTDAVASPSPTPPVEPAAVDSTPAKVALSVDTPYSALESYLTQQPSAPLLQSSEPFGSTMLYATRGAVCQVLPNNLVSLVTLFRDVQ